ncbi:GNAT family N-acetyltransferase [Oscillatoria sp. CS-180]|uniref:GNAT family N-acetyltransferase n=1 Tax=Oscillatoria sp. CS-180 TaxID=3021720 RepID=UPI00232EBB7A|nr:GNAT family N-acetyltransferase [Oscillatoria sp. CS-180]MDB9525277.1 GNAT family N-acetyltransferase [Oscillatoria sp. CS-180]
MVPLIIRSLVSLPVDVDSVSFCVRPAAVNDLQQVADVLVSSFYPPLGWQRWFHPLFRFSIYEDLKQRLQGGHQHYRCLTAIAPDRKSRRNVVIGTVELSYRRQGLWTFNRPQQMYISNLAVRENCRRQGIARRLLQNAEQLSLEWGFRELYLHVMADNTRARRLYQNMGYQLQQVEPTLFSLLSLQPSRLLLKKVLSPQTVAYPSSSSAVRRIPY